MLAKELRGGEVICLVGELGSGKTTFAQGILKGMGAKGPFSSPTFVIIKQYRLEYPISNTQYPSKLQITNYKFQKKYQISDTKYKIQNIYHVDAYRVGAKDILDLGWEEIIASKNDIMIIEWAEKIKRIIPRNAIWIRFKHRGKDEREISF